MSKSSICFLFGSGISIHAEMPGTRDFSDLILSGDNVIRDQHKTYTPFDPLNPSHTIRGMDLRSGVREILPLISALKAEADVHYQGSVSSNYEDWFYLADQLGRGSDDYDNPACWAFRESLRPRVERRHALSPHVKRIEVLADEACQYIADLVLQGLSTPPKKVALDWIINAVRDDGVDAQGLFTLNHDLVLETLFEKHQEPYTVGFEKAVPDSTMLHWDEDSLLQKSEKTVIAKLHGSVDWREKNNLGEFLRDDQRTMTAFRRRPKDQAKEGSTPMMLIGRHNKLYHYSSYVYDVLQFCFHQALKASDVLVVCGYGWGDKGVNSKILNWRFSGSNTLVVIRPDEPFPETSRLAVLQGMANWKDNKRIVHISARAEDMTWDRLKAELEERTGQS
jgi:hypothetical protein